MVLHPIRKARRAFAVGIIGLVIGAGLAGCGKAKVETPAKENAAGSAADDVPASPSVAPEKRLCQSFGEATQPEPPEDQILPYVSLSGKSVGKLYEDAVKMWDQVRFATPQGKRLNYQATLDTDLGDIDIALFADAAPNHVRSFVALAKIGYYDGLVFERIIRDQSEEKPENKVELVEAGCPLGTGNPGLGSIGYWLKPEFSDQLKHEEGTVGACLGESPDTGACRFYITLSRAPVMDGNRTVFGKVTRGLDIVRRISTQPLLNAPEFPDGTRPEHPVAIRKVTIQVKEVQ